MSADCPIPSEPLRGRTVLLRSWAVEEASWYVSARDDEVFRWTSEPPDLSVEAVREVIGRNRAHPRWVALAITDAMSGALLGNIALNPAGQPPGVAEVSYWLATESRGRGAATEALALLVEWTFASGAFNRIILHTMPGNERSQSVARRAGFTLVHTDETRHRFALDSPRPEQPEVPE
jgi:RimJ/RimL family protein N-acetyltransferase